MRSLHHEVVLFQKGRNYFRYVPANYIEEEILCWNPSKTKKNSEVKTKYDSNFDSESEYFNFQN